MMASYTNVSDSNRKVPATSDVARLKRCSDGIMPCNCECRVVAVM